MHINRGNMQGGGVGWGVHKPDFPVSKTPPQGQIGLSSSLPPGIPCLLWNHAIVLYTYMYVEFPAPLALIGCLIPASWVRMVCLDVVRF